MEEHKTDGTPCWCNPKIVKVRTKEEKEIAFYLYDRIYELGKEDEQIRIKNEISREGSLEKFGENKEFDLGYAEAIKRILIRIEKK